MATDIFNMGLRFKEMAQLYPEHTALRMEDGDVASYQELDRHSDHVAALLIAKNLSVVRPLAIFADKTIWTYACMVGALKAGVPYVVLDMESPAERLDKILDRCQPGLIISSDAAFAWKNTEICHFTQLEGLSDVIAPEHITQVVPETPAYLMFTSGSTGFPKGVTISHASMLNFCHWAQRTFSITQQDVLSGVNPLYFDNSVFDFTASLFNGACLMPVTRGTLKQAKKLVEQLKACTMWFSVPSMLIYLMAMKALTRESWPAMRAIIFGGEGYAKTELQKLFNMYGSQATLWNVYGPTECTCICSAYAISKKDFADMDMLAPLGFLAEEFNGLVLDEAGKQVADGEIGELLLCGSQVAIGYYNDAERTAASFLINPVTQASGQMCYRTGDLVLRDPATGYLHFKGRKDNQIKHMGYRIELEEIEAALAGFTEVSQGAVVYHRKTAAAGRIVAFVTLAQDIAAQDIKNRLRSKLPSYMIPDEVTIMDALPKNANGKVDRKALLAGLG